MIRRYYQVINTKTQKPITTLLKRDFKSSFYADVVAKLKSKEYILKVY